MNYKIKAFLIHCLLPILLGVFVYALLRPDSFFYVKNELFKQENVLVKIIRNHFADAMWAYSLTSSIFIFTNIKPKIILILSMTFCTLQEVFTAKYFEQTFDWFDVIVMSFFCLLVFLFRKKIRL